MELEEEDDWEPLQENNLLLDKVIINFTDKKIKQNKKAEEKTEDEYLK